MAAVVEAVGYRCPQCNEAHGEESEARGCCTGDLGVEVEVYTCRHCETEYSGDEAYEEAKTCCVEKVKVTVRCPDCNQRYYGTDEDVVRQAQRCCSDPGEPATEYACSTCNARYEYRTDADHCHKTVEKTKDVWACKNCGTVWGTKREAAGCC